jgi:hypothetical protein
MGPIQGFANAGLLGLAALAVVPLLIHLLHRRRPKPLAWGAMRLVRLAHERTRRRTRLENLLLLLLRMAIVASCALFLARPLLGPAAAGSAIEAEQRDAVVILDASASMQCAEQGESAFARALREATLLLQSLRSERGDRALLILAGENATVLSERGVPEALRALADLQPLEDGRADYAGACALLLSWLERRSALEVERAPEIHLYSDRQRTAFSSPEFAAALDTLVPSGIPIWVHGCGDVARPENLALSGLQVLQQHPRPGLAFAVEAAVTNQGPTAATARIALYVGGERSASEALSIDAGATGRVRFDARVAAAGAPLLEARLEGDAYALDDAAGVVVDVAGPLQVLLVVGESSRAIERDPSAYIQAALGAGANGDDAPSASSALFETQVIGAADLDSGELDLASPAIVWLVDLTALSPAATAALRARVQAGGALIVSCGPRTAPDTWSAFETPAASADPTVAADASAMANDRAALLPAQPGEAVVLDGRGAGYFRAATIDATDPALAFFGDERWRPLLCELPFHGFVRARPSPGARVLASFDDPEQSPLLVEGTLGRGHVWLWTSSFDSAWSRLPDSPRTLVPLLHEWLLHAGRPDRAPRHARVGATLAAEVRGFPRTPEWIAPGGRRIASASAPLEIASDLWRVECAERALRVGSWSLSRQGEAPLDWWIELPPQERLLERLPAEGLSLLHPLLRAHELRELASTTDGGAADDANGRTELWRVCAWICLAILVAESLWAAWIGRGRA